jgi:hypothetical protein
MARVNAASLRGTPELEVAGHHYFRSEYLESAGLSWYRNGHVPSPLSHYQWVKDWWTYPLLVHAAPRGSCKTTINLEDILRHVVTNRYWECALFLSTKGFISDRMGRLMTQITNNSRMIDDFGNLKPKRSEGMWNRGSCIELTNGSKVEAFPITGASLGARPSGILILDDVEKSDDLVITPSDLRQNFENFFFNAIYPMANSPGKKIPIRIIGTLYNFRMFIYWLHTTDDPKVAKFWKRTKMTIHDLDWDVMGPEWQEGEKERLGPANFSAQYLNQPTTDADRILQVDPELCTYWLEDVDDAAYNDPLNSDAIVVTHSFAGTRKTHDGTEVPVPHIHHRKWREILPDMRRFITVDSCRTTTPSSDFSVIHAMGFENSHEHRDTLYSLDIWVGRVRPEELIRRLYQMALKWHVSMIGVEAYPVLAEFYERVRDDLPGMYGEREAIPRILPLKTNTKIDKGQKIMQMEWRFRHFRVKLPIDRSEEPGYKQLFHQIENFTEDLALLQYDDAIDTLAMHTMIGKQHKSVAPDVYKPVNLIEEMKKGEVEIGGVPLMSGINAADLTNEDLRTLLDKRYDELEEDGEIDGDEWLLGWVPLEDVRDYMY